MNRDIQEKILKRLFELDYEVKSEDYSFIESCMEKAEAYFSMHCKSCKDKRILPYFIDHVCGLFFKEKLMSKNTNENFSSDKIVSSLKIGDTSISFKDSSKGDDAEKSYSALLCPKEVLACFRKMTW